MAVLTAAKRLLQARGTTEVERSYRNSASAELLRSRVSRFHLTKATPVAAHWEIDVSHLLVIFTSRNGRGLFPHARVNRICVVLTCPRRSRFCFCYNYTQPNSPKPLTHILQSTMAKPCILFLHGSGTNADIFRLRA